MKAFLIIGNLNAVTYKEVFPMIKEGKVRLGVNNGNMAFRVPPDSGPRATRYWQDDTGQKWRSLGNSCWFTNLEYDVRHNPIHLSARYTPEAYPKYDNYDAIEVGRTENIPCDYDGAMGVPITFLDKYCPEQFEIIKFRHGDDGKDLAVNGKCPFCRILIRRRRTSS